MKSRTQYTTLNLIASLAVQPLKVATGFVNRTIFISTLGIAYLSLSGLLTSILSILSLAELGVGAAMSYALYKPLADNDNRKVTAYMQLFEKLYRIIGGTILVLGVGLSFFLPFFITDQEINSEVRTIYYLFLINSVVSYFFVYKRTLIEADQKKYKLTILDFVVFMVGNIIQIILLLLTKNYYIYLACTILMTIIGNIVVSRVVNKEYPYILVKEKIKITKDEKTSFIKNIKGLMVSKLGDTVVFGTDNILMSSFIGLNVVGLYSNYTYLTTILSSFMIMFINSVRSSIGNLVHHSESSKEKVLDFLKTYQFILFMILFFLNLGIFMFINPVISLWLGNDYIFEMNVVLIIAINYFITSYRFIFSSFISVYGLNYEQNIKTIIEAILNIIFSLALLYFTDLGIVAVLGGTILSSILTVVWYEPYSVFKYGLKTSGKAIYITIVRHYLIMLTTFIIVYVIEVNYIMHLTLWSGIFYRVVLYILIFLVFTLFTYKKVGYKFIRTTLMRLVKLKRR